jgi:hypothetical protein
MTPRLLLCCLALCANSLSAAPAPDRSFGFNYATTSRGELSITRTVETDSEVQLNGKRILHGDTRHVLWFVADARPSVGVATLVLLGFDTGDNSCRFLYRVLDTSPAGAFTLSPEFGDCSEYDLKANALEPATGSSPEEWVLPGFRKKNSVARFVYKRRKIFRDGRQVQTNASR